MDRITGGILAASAVIMLAAMILSFARFLRGPGFLNRITAFDTMTIISLSLIGLVSFLLGRMLYLDVALVYGLLSFLGVIAFARFAEGGL